MSQISTIEWTDATWNPMLGCSKTSPGCKGCYAINHVHRMAGNPNAKIAAANAGLTIIQNGHPNWTGKVRLIPERLSIPARTRKPTTFFVNSLSDLFHESFSYDDIMAVLRRAGECQQHRFQILTKRSERMWGFLEGRFWRYLGPGYVPVLRGHETTSDVASLPNVWFGVSVESRDYLHRIDDLRKTPAAVRFLSLEPLLEDLGRINLEGIHWVIVGGESGRGARLMPPEWVRSIRDQCEAAGVPFFFKQWGEWAPVANHGEEALPSRIVYRDVPVGDGTHHRMFRVGKKKAGRLLDGRTWDEMPRTASTLAPSESPDLPGGLQVNPGKEFPFHEE